MAYLGLPDGVCSGGTVLYAPTFRKHAADEDWRKTSVEALRHALPADMMLIVSGHPLDRDAWRDTGRGTVRYLQSFSSMDVLESVDYVVTDYSSVAFEAALVGGKVLFYVPDIEEYRHSPGLNIDPEHELPTITFRNAEALGQCITDDRDHGAYDVHAFTTFMNDYGISMLRDAPESSCTRITALAEHLLNGSRKKGSQTCPRR